MAVSAPAPAPAPPEETAVAAAVPVHRKPIARVRRGALLRVILPHLPHDLLKSASHILYLSPQGQYWDLKTTATVEFLRSYINHRASHKSVTVEKAQADTVRRTKVANNTWVSEVAFSPAPDFNGEAAVKSAIVSLGGTSLTIPPVGIAPLSGEWVAGRSTRIVGEPPHLSTEENYTGLTADTPNKDAVILYLHGGAYFLCDPHSHRAAIVKLAAASQCRAFALRYRLAPQSPFPAALIDSLAAYLYLLHPPPGALHKPVPASKIVFAGDSAGGGLSFSLLQLLLEFSRSSTTILWHGTELTPPLPAGIAGCSPWIDVTRCFGGLSDFTTGSEETCGPTDYLPTSVVNARAEYPESPGWNAEVRKKMEMSQMYAADALLSHPLVSPILAESWKGKDGVSVPVWISVGDECLRDQSLWATHYLRKQGVRVRFEKYAGMPHVFQGILFHLKVADHAWASGGKFIKLVTGDVAAEEGYWTATETHPKTLVGREMTEEELHVGGFEMNEVREMAQKAVVAVQKVVTGRDAVRAKI